MKQQIIDFLYNNFWLVPISVFILGWLFFYILEKLITFIEFCKKTERGYDIITYIFYVVITVVPISIITFIIYNICQELL